MKRIPFEYCAFRYFEQWFLHEEALHLSMKSKPSAGAVRRSLQYFKVARSFKGLSKPGVAELIKDELLRVESLRAVDSAEKVNELAGRFRAQFGQFNISAASKLLWLSNIEGYLIYDSRAVAGLKKLGAPIKGKDYSAYELEWRQAFSEHNTSLQNATSKLPMVKAWLPYWPDSESEIQSVINQHWFRERVFDIYLWELSAL